jgi:uncharacterized protein YjcR
MAKARSPARDKAKELWLESGKKKPLKEIADEVGKSAEQVRKWKNQDKWDDGDSKSNVTNQTKGNVTKHKSKRYPNGHPGNPNPVRKFTERNQAAATHGLWSKYIHDDQLEIMQSLNGTSAADQLWLMIEIKFSAIIRAQQIMYVNSADDHLNEISGDGETTSYKVAYAYERYDAYLTAQSRAMAEYRNLIKQFATIADEEDERRLKLKKMQLDVDMKQHELETIKEDPEAAGQGFKEYLKATMPTPEEVKALFDDETV